jgi:4-amino-4-deoxy-L-arabinose transferase-like glycosyltransferase
MSSQDRRVLRWTVALAVVAFLVPLAVTHHAFDRWDEIEYIRGAQQIASGAKFVSEKRLPFFSCLIAAVHLLIPDWSVAAWVTARLLGAALVVATAGLAAESFGAAAGAIAALLIATAPLPFAVATLIQTSTQVALFMTLAAWALVRARARDSSAALAWANLCVALAGFTRPEGFALVPLILWIDVRRLARRDVRPRAKAGVAAGIAAIGLSAAWFLGHFWYGRNVVNTLGAAGAAAHVVDLLANYLRILPWMLSFGTAALAVAGMVALAVDARRATLTASQRRFAAVFAWLTVAVLIGLSTYEFWSSLYLAPLLPLVTVVAAHGLERLARALARTASARRIVLAAALVPAVGVNLGFSLFEMTQLERILGDYHDACLWLRDALGRSDSAPATDAGAELVVASEPVHLQWWTGIRSAPYRRDLARRAHHVVLCDLLGQNYGFDYDEELAWCERELGARVVFSSERWIRPVLGMTLCLPARYLFTPRILDVRWREHCFRSVVLEVPYRRRRDR